MELEPGIANRKTRELFLYACFSVLGLSFWFFLGFPFANHNESYGWIAQINQMPANIRDVLLWSPALNYRPLGSITAWLGFRLSNGSIYPQQIFNFAVAVLAWLILYLMVSEKKLFGWISCIIGGAFFSGYIYLFHLHGVFYSPLLLLVAILTGIAVQNGIVTYSKWLVIFFLAVIISLYHPFALLIYMAFALGYLLENRHTLTRIQLATASIFLIVAIILMKILVHQSSLFPSKWALGLSTSYKLVEIQSILSILSWILCMITVLSLNTPWRIKVITGIIAIVLSLACIFWGQPVLFIWIALCLTKTVLLKKWSIAALLIVSVLLPVVTATGSPTYTIFVLMVCSVVIPFQWSFPAIETALFNKVVLAMLILACLMGVLLRNGIHLPVVSVSVNPILAEREKTFQLENIMKWREASDYTQYKLVLCGSADNPTESTNAANRKNRPPTSQQFLDEYTSSLTPLHNENTTAQLLVCFGDEKIKGAELLYSIPGNYNGQAIVVFVP